MTLTEAVAVLNERKHGDYDNWYEFNYAVRCNGPPHQCLSFFEAIAIAEKYLRETRIAAKKEKGQTRKQRRREIRQRRTAREARYQRIIDTVLSTGSPLNKHFSKLRDQLFRASRGHGLENVRNQRAEEIRERRNGSVPVHL